MRGRWIAGVYERCYLQTNSPTLHYHSTRRLDDVGRETFTDGTDRDTLGGDPFYGGYTTTPGLPHRTDFRTVS